MRRESLPWPGTRENDLMTSFMSSPSFKSPRGRGRVEAASDPICDLANLCSRIV
jgi:hypothetical protein